MGCENRSQYYNRGALQSEKQCQRFPKNFLSQAENRALRGRNILEEELISERLGSTHI